MWEVTVSIKDKNSGSLVSRKEKVYFENRNSAEKYILENCEAVAKDGLYATAFISHPNYGNFNSDPTLWDIINLQRLVAYAERPNR